MTLFRSPESSFEMEHFSSLRMELDDYQKNILMKASSLSNDVRDVTIGPKGRQTEVEFKIRRPKKSSPKLMDPVVSREKNLKVSSLRRTAAEDSLVDISTRTRMKLLHELELIRQQDLTDKMIQRMERLELVERAQREEMLHQHEMSLREKQSRLLQEEENILQQLHNEELMSIRRQEEMANAHKLHAKRIHELSQLISEAQQRQREAEEEERRRLTERKIQLDKIHQYQVDYRAKFQKIHDDMKSCKDRAALSAVTASHTAKIKNLNEAIEQLVKQCKVGEISNLDLQTAASLVQQIGEISNIINNEVAMINDRWNKAEDAKREAAATAAAKSAAEQAAERSSSAGGSNTAGETSPYLNKVVSKEAAKDYMALQEFHQEFQNTYTDLLKDERMKKFRFECQKAVNIPVNTISAVNAHHMHDKLTKLSRLLSGQNVEVSQGNFSAAAHPQGIAFCKNLMAKKFVEQGSTVISSKPEAAFAFAAVAVALWTDFPDFGQLLLAHFYKACPYLVPIFLPQLEGQSDQDFYKSLGYLYSENGEVEKQDKFLKRMSGIMRLYAAILITPPRRGQTKPHPHGLKQGWRWIACMLNAEPQPDICASLLFDFLEVAGNAMFTNYGHQFQKLLHLICKEYFPRLEKVTSSDSRGPLARLENFLQTIIKQGRIAPPDGQLPVNFW
ncbi:mRNA export factor GLE1 [Anabrus simplex]|uniref:mRNA export factor GLE1 n=1 Tax=Anabrus simplex TaxID=316456 RepID=UPI0035A374CE